MYAGRVVESGPKRGALLRPADTVHVGASGLDPAARPTQAAGGCISHSAQARRHSLINAPRGCKVPAPVPAACSTAAASMRPVPWASVEAPRPASLVAAGCSLDDKRRLRGETSSAGRADISCGRELAKQTSAPRSGSRVPAFDSPEGFTRRRSVRKRSMPSTAVVSELARAKRLARSASPAAGSRRSVAASVRLLAPTSGEIVFGGSVQPASSGRRAPATPAPRDADDLSGPAREPGTTV